MLAKTVNSKSHTLQYRVIIIELSAKVKPANDHRATHKNAKPVNDHRVTRANVKPANDHRATRRSTVGQLYIIAQCANVKPANDHRATRKPTAS